MRFVQGTPDNDLSLAGVLVHQWDGQEDSHGTVDRRWLPCPTSVSWCAEFGDRFASSIINRRMNGLFNTQGGLIFRTSPAEVNEILCSWAADGGTMEKVCHPLGPSEDCMPGCWMETPNWCTPQRNWQCAFRPNDLQSMMRVFEAATNGNDNTYNEVIVDALYYVRHLPNSLEAMFVKSAGDQTTRRAHANFLAAYGLTADDVPLLLYTGNRGGPFRRLV